MTAVTITVAVAVAAAVAITVTVAVAITVTVVVAATTVPRCCVGLVSKSTAVTSSGRCFVFRFCQAEGWASRLQ